MQVIFRTDASLIIGTGHVMRCLTLADKLRDLGANCTFICRDQPGNLIELIATRGYPVLKLDFDNDSYSTNSSTCNGSLSKTKSQVKLDAYKTVQLINEGFAVDTIDWIVVDHYDLDIDWEQCLRAASKYILVIDDLANRMHECDMLLDNNLGRSSDDYSELVSSETVLLIGPQYSLLRPEFSLFRQQSIYKRIQNPVLKKIFISLGGVDINNTTCEVLSTLCSCPLPSDSEITIVMGPHAPWLSEVRKQASTLPWKTTVLTGVNNIAELMANSDIAIGAAGVSAWERCALGLPSIVFILADNQVPGAMALHNSGSAIVLNSTNQLVETFQFLLSNVNSTSSLLNLIRNSSILTDGTGSTYLAHKMLNFNV